MLYLKYPQYRNICNQLVIIIHVLTILYVCTDDKVNNSILNEVEINVLYQFQSIYIFDSFKYSSSRMKKVIKAQKLLMKLQNRGVSKMSFGQHSFPGCVQHKTTSGQHKIIRPLRQGSTS